MDTTIDVPNVPIARIERAPPEPVPRADSAAWVPARSEAAAEPPDPADRQHCGAWVPAPWEVMVENFHRATQKHPDDWQVRPGVNATQLGKDTVVLAPTGSGKTFPQVISAFLHAGVSVIILMPLNELEKLQMNVKKFRKWGLKAYVLNQQTKTPELMKIIRNRDFQVLCTSPEQMDLDSGLRSFASNPEWAKNLVIVIDEAHCIPRWKDSFRKTYASIGSFRAYLPHHVPFIACTATATPEDVRIICETLQLGADVDIINLGNHRPNLIWEVRQMSGAAQSTHEVDFMIPDGVARVEEIEQQLLFCNSRPMTHILAHRLKQRLPEDLRHTVEIYHSLRTVRQRAWAMYRFERGETRIIVCSEAIAMGCDFQNITRVIQFMITDSLTTWIQRGGRGGRNPALTCRCIMLVQPSVFQLIKPRKKRAKKKAIFDVPTLGPMPEPESGNAHEAEAAELESGAPSTAEHDGSDSDDSDKGDDEDEDDEVQLVPVEIEVEVEESAARNGGIRTGSTDSGHTGSSQQPSVPSAATTAKKKKVKKIVHQQRVFAKRVPKDLRAFVSTKECRGQVIDVTYMNPPHPDARSGCCDICIARTSTTAAETSSSGEEDEGGERDEEDVLPPRDESGRDGAQPESVQDDAQPAPRARKEAGTGDRRSDALETARASVFAWRYATWKRDMRRSLLGEQAVLSDADLQVVSKKRSIRDERTLREAVPTWGLHEKYGQSLLAVLLEIGAQEDAARARVQREKDEARAAAQRLKDETRRREQAERQATRQAARRPSKKQLRQAERDALVQAGQRPRGAPTKIELQRRAALAQGATRSPVGSSPALGPSGGQHTATGQGAIVPSSPTSAGLNRAVHSSAAGDPSTSRNAPFPLPSTPHSALPQRVTTTLNAPMTPPHFAFALKPTPMRPTHASVTQPSGTPTNFVVSPLLQSGRRVLGDANSRKRLLDSGGMDAGEQSSSKRQRTE